MSNIYLEKIALTIEDTRAARTGGMKAGRKVDLKGSAIGAGIVGSVGAAAGYYKAHSGLKSGRSIPLLRSTGLSPRKFKIGAAALGGAFGAIGGLGIGSSAVAESSERARIKEHTRLINKGLSKEAKVTENQVRARSQRNDAVAALAGVPGAVLGGAAGLGVVGAHGIHKGLKDSGGYTSIRNSLKNAYQRKKSEKVLGKGSTLMGKGNAVALATQSRESIAKKAGNSFGKALNRSGVVGATLGAFAGAGLAASRAVKHNDKSDVSHYKRLSTRNG